VLQQLEHPRRDWEYATTGHGLREAA